MVAYCPTLPTTAGMTIVGSSRAGSSPERGDHCRWPNPSRPPAIALLFILTVPAGRREPDLEFNFGIAGGTRYGPDHAARGHIDGRQVSESSGGGKWTFGDEHRRNDGSVAK